MRRAMITLLGRELRAESHAHRALPIALQDFRRQVPPPMIIRRSSGLLSIFARRRRAAIDSARHGVLSVLQYTLYLSICAARTILPRARHDIERHRSPLASQ